jgi:hypothetical protein
MNVKKIAKLKAAEGMQAGRIGANARRRKFAAYHEAGHAVIADYFGVLEEVSIEGVEVTSFRCCPMQGIIIYAGIIAQARYQHRSLAYAAIKGGKVDLEQVYEMANNLALALEGQCEPADFRKRWKKKARALLSQLWAMVKSVAELLMKEGRATAGQVRQLRPASQPVCPLRFVYP